MADVGHRKKHSLISAADHSAGNIPSVAGQVNVVGTASPSTVVEVLVEEPDPISISANTVVRRGVGGHIVVPTNTTNNRHAISFEQAQEMIESGPYRSPVVCATSPGQDHTSSSVLGIEDGELRENDRVIDLTDGKIYTVVIGGANGALVEAASGWDAGELPDSDIIVYNYKTGTDWYFDHARNEWINREGVGNVGTHDITSSTHTAAANKSGIVYATEGRVETLRLVDDSGDNLANKWAPVLSSGEGVPTVATGVSNFLRLAPDVVALASLDTLQTNGTIGGWPVRTLGIVLVGNEVYLAFKRVDNVVVCVEMTA